jgi:hypothetical protein
MAKSGISHVVTSVPVPRSQYESEVHHALNHGNSFPASPDNYQLFFRDDLGKWYIRWSGSWIELTSQGVTVHNTLTGRDAADCHPLAAVTGLADHSARHELAGADVLSLAGLSGEPAELTTHKGLTTGVHGAGSNHLALFGAASTVVSRVVNLAEPVNVVTDESRTTELAWTDLDLTAFTSATAKMAILYIRFVVVDAGTSSYNDVRIRPNGSSFNNPAVFVQGNAANDGANACNTVIVGMDADQVIEYSIDIAAGGVVLHTYIWVLGYIE